MDFTREDTRALKGIAIVLMLYHHLFAFSYRIPAGAFYFSPFTLLGYPSAFWVGIFGSICVALFAFLGGYGTRRAAESAQGSLALLLGRKILRIYTLYWQVFCIFIPLCILRGVQGMDLSPAGFLGNFTGWHITYNMEWWFFTPYLAMLLCYPAVHRLLGAKPHFAADLVLLAAAAAGCLYGAPMLAALPAAAPLVNSTLGSNLTAALEMLPAFWAGALCAKYRLFRALKARLRGRRRETLAALAVLLLVLPLRYLLRRVPDFVYAPVFCMAAYVLFQCRAGARARRIFAAIGGESTYIWLTHSFYCYTLCPLLIYRPHFTPLIALWLLALSYLTARMLRTFYSLRGADHSCFFPRSSLTNHAG